jgi:hypothetical protein
MGGIAKDIGVWGYISWGSGGTVGGYCYFDKKECPVGLNIQSKKEQKDKIVISRRFEDWRRKNEPLYTMCELSSGGQFIRWDYVGNEIFDGKNTCAIISGHSNHWNGSTWYAEFWSRKTIGVACSGHYFNET